MKNELLSLMVFGWLISSSCNLVEIKTPSFFATLENNAESQICGVYLQSPEIGKIQIDEFECSSNHYFSYFGVDLYEGRDIEKEYASYVGRTRLDFPVDSAIFEEWGECVLSSLFASSHDEYEYNNGDEVSYISKYNVYQLYVDEDSIHVLKRKFKFDKAFNKEPEQDKPIWLFSASKHDIQSGAISEQTRIAQRRRWARDSAGELKLEVEDSNNTKSFDEIQLTLTDASFKKAKLYLGEPDYSKFAHGHLTKGFAIYYDRVSNGSKPKHLVLFLRMQGNQWGDHAAIEEIHSVDNNQRACFGVHCINVSRTSKTSQSESFTSSSSNIEPSARQVSNTKGEFPQASERLLRSSDLEYMTFQDLAIMRNEIFARHGYIFKTEHIRDHFSRQPWYKPRFDDVTSMLTQIEKQNIELIKSFE